MSRRHISQREAHVLAKRVAELESEQNTQRERWAREYPGGVLLGKIIRERDWFSGRMEAVGLLGHAVVARVADDGDIKFYALPLPKRGA